jgi:hydroxypyruvate isomerase
MPKLCANISMLFNEEPFLKRYALAAKSGFKTVESLFPEAFSVAQVVGALEESGLKQVLMNTSTGHWEAGERGMACDPSRVSQFKSSVYQALDYALPMGKPLLHVMAGLVPSGLALEEAEQTYVANFIWAAAQAKKVGVNLTIEAINPIDMPCYLVSTQAQALRLLKQINAENVGLQFDFFHCEKFEGDALTRFKQVLPFVSHIQIAGVPDRHEPDTGLLDYQSVFKAIDQSDYSGFVGCEYRPKTTTQQGLRWMATLAASS